MRLFFSPIRSWQLLQNTGFYLLGTYYNASAENERTILIVERAIIGRLYLLRI